MASGNLIVVSEESALLKYRDKIFRLFAECFGRPLNPHEWEWLLLRNPMGSPIIALYTEGEDLLGHFALVPFRFRDVSRPITAWRSGTTMIHPAASLPGLMAILGRAAQEQAVGLGSELIFGFPNDNSTVGFRRFLRWTVSEDEYLLDVPGSAVINEPAAFLSANEGVRLDTSDAEQMAWRLGRPSVEYAVEPGLVTSEYEGATQILLLEPEGLDAISPQRTYRVYVHRSSPLPSSRLRRYRYGSFTPNTTASSMARPSLIWSDVF